MGVTNPAYNHLLAGMPSAGIDAETGAIITNVADGLIEFILKELGESPEAWRGANAVIDAIHTLVKVIGRKQTAGDMSVQDASYAQSTITMMTMIGIQTHPFNPDRLTSMDPENS